MFERKERCWCARRDSNSRPSGSKSFDLRCQILPEEWLIERIQQVGEIPANHFPLLLLSSTTGLPLFSAICVTFS
jgi:hypothetical protein